MILRSYVSLVISKLKVIYQSDLLLVAVSRESDAAAPEHKFSQLFELYILVEELLDQATVIVVRQHEVLLEIHEFIHVRQLMGHLLLEPLHLQSSV